MKNTKNTLQKLLSALLLLSVLAGVALLNACGEPLVIKDSDTYIVIKTPEKLEHEDMLLIEYMAQLEQKGKLELTISDGMITSLNGIENPPDYSKCWMLYTSDAEYSNAAWGTVEYEGVEYGSAISGAETLPILPGQLYIWVFKSFS